ncbi:MAG TPA: hypothetical protein VK735_39520 [Pseudonocardia sp.]|uniref:hypothetical protein n=1 Tax=Pseudonocardia sp. TaxID=60912 RepID=UPI002C4F5EE7|nr:hypothetical protein [Pseudonocardia sp.]HTF53572.1 hypothetical protein [Pseudonocardia sp.]
MFTAKLNNVDGPGGEAAVGHVNGRFCYSVPVHVVDDEGSQVDVFDANYFDDEHDQTDLEPEYQCPNLDTGPGRELVLRLLREHGWGPVGESWDDGTWDGTWEYIRVNRSKRS